MRVLVLLFCWISCFGGKGLLGQSQGVLVQCRSAAQAKALFADKARLPTFQSKECLSPRWQIYLLQSDQAPALLHALRQQPAVTACQYNHAVQWRSAPTNDPKRDRQWPLDSIGLPDAWDKTNSGLSPQGDSIACAVIDGTFDVTHEDLAANIWHNYREIPNNGLDDDQNGYIDDFTGWQVLYNTDRHDYGALSNHGSSVLGIIGARGDNNLGVTGINPQLKLLLLSANTAAGITRLSNIIEAYSYILAMRERYDRSNGQEGAYVVAVNASWGIDFAWAAEHPIWCGLFDSLGQAGILSIAATTNSDANVDRDGDMPCTCPSPYLIAVSESDRNHTPLAGYGKTHIDLFTAGQNHTTRWGNNYGDFGGTSGAAPHVSGAVALLYSFKHTAWGAAQKDDPAAAALLVKNSLLRGALRTPQLSASVSGGRLHLGQALEKLEQHFEAPKAPGFMAVFPNPSRDWVTIELAHTEAGEHTYTLYNTLGQVVRQQTFSYDRPSTQYWNLWLGDLSAGAYRLVVKIEEQYYQQTVVKH